MKRVVVFLLIVGSVFSCVDREVKVPRIALNGAEKVADHSVIWMFRNDDGTLDLNEKNRISSTHWFFNIDKKLSLNEMLPEVKRLVIKHNTKSPHNTKKMNNYFTYVNSLNDHLSFYQFDSIVYKEVKENNLPQFLNDTILVTINSIDFKLPEIPKNKKVQMAFNSVISFQNYLEVKALIINRVGEKNIAKVEYIITE